MNWKLLAIVGNVVSTVLLIVGILQIEENWRLKEKIKELEKTEIMCPASSEETAPKEADE